MDRGIGCCLSWAEKLLVEKNITTARLDAGVLLAHVLNTQRTYLAAYSEQQITSLQYEKFSQLIERRAKAEPVAYLTGMKEFWSLPICVDARVLIPRPETELMVESAQKIFKGRSPKLFVDVGCGSGCVACALAESFTKSRGMALDFDEKALEVAHKNIQKLGFSNRVEVIKSNGLDAVPDKSADLICANLPYIPSAECKNLPADIRYYEPMTALDGGRDGLEIIRVVLEQSLQKLLPTGHIILELGEGQAPIVMDLCQKLGFTNVYAEKDLSGIQRAVVASQNH